MDYLRGVAILSVFAFHCLWKGFGYDTLPWKGWFHTYDVDKAFYFVFPATFGAAGVAIFFAVSGFCIHLSHQRSRDKSFRVFFIRRFFRIYPPYLLALIFFAVFFFPIAKHFFPQFNDTPQTFPQQLYQFGMHLFLVHNFDPKTYFGVSPAFWSIAVECQLYLIYPLLLWLVTAWGWRKTLWVTAMIEFSLRTLESIWIIANPAGNLPQVFTASPLSFWFSWTLGAALADAYLKGDELPFRSRLGFLFPILFVGFYFFLPLTPYRFSLMALSTTYLMSYWLAHPPTGLKVKGWLSYPLEHLRWAGVVSYSAYLIHQPLMNQVTKVVGIIFHHPSLSDGVLYAICLASWLPIFALSYLCYRYIELPSIEWGKQIIAGTKAQSAVLSA